MGLGKQSKLTDDKRQDELKRVLCQFTKERSGRDTPPSPRSNPALQTIYASSALVESFSLALLSFVSRVADGIGATLGVRVRILRIFAPKIYA